MAGLRCEGADLAYNLRRIQSPRARAGEESRRGAFRRRGLLDSSPSSTKLAPLLSEMRSIVGEERTKDADSYLVVVAAGAPGGAFKKDAKVSASLARGAATGGFQNASGRNPGLLSTM